MAPIDDQRPGTRLAVTNPGELRADEQPGPTPSKHRTKIDCAAIDCRLAGGLITNQPSDRPATSTPVVPASEGEAIKLEGKVVAVLPGTMFRVQLTNGHIVLAHLSGKMRKHYVRIAAGDSVKLEMSPYDTDKARITFRNKVASSTYRPLVRRRY